MQKCVVCMVKNLYLIGGTMGVGKTTVSKKLMKLLPDSVLLDGDWCWMSDPFQVTDETKSMVIDNICHMLNNFIKCSAYRNIIFCWVMHQQSIIDDIISRLDISGCNIRSISLVADVKALEGRLKKDIASGLRNPDIIERSTARIPLYEELDTEKFDVSSITADEAARIISES